MISSMTGFGAGRAGEGTSGFSVEVKSVNHRACDVKIRMPHDMSSLETELTKCIKERVQRGSVEVFIRRAEAMSSAGEITLTLNRQIAESYLEAARQLSLDFGLSGNVTISELLAVDGVVIREVKPLDVESLKAPLFEALNGAIDGLQEMRRREGEALASDLRRRLKFIQDRVDRVRELSPKTVEHYRQRLEERIAEITKGMAVDPQRLAQEVAIFTDKVDVTEEITRLDTHLRAFDCMLERTDATGRSMDFLIQEINRETNTIGSKSQSSEIAAIVIEVKSEIERIREQVQNIL